MNHFMLLIGAYLMMANPEFSNIKLDQQDWAAFKSQHNKSYASSREETFRSSVFAYNKLYVDKFNAEHADARFSLGVNHLADLSELEMKLRNGYKARLSEEQQNTPEGEKFLNDILNDDSIEVPDELDWRKVPGRVSAVKDQGQCGGCWAFASTGALEGQEKVRRSNSSSVRGDLVQLSEQNLIDCVKFDFGCDGGNMQDAFEYVNEAHGIDTEESYPYEGVNGQCRFKKDKIAFTDKGSVSLPSGDEEKLKEVVAKFGPVAVGIDASKREFQLYTGGIFYNELCSTFMLDHAVLIVGYGTDKRWAGQLGDYWIVKNSWGSNWGEDGYIRMSRNQGNNCGIASAAAIPTF